MTRGTALPIGADPAAGPGRDRTAYYIGIGTLEMGRREIFTGGNGVAVAVHQRVFHTPPFPGAPPMRPTPRYSVPEALEACMRMAPGALAEQHMHAQRCCGSGAGRRCRIFRPRWRRPC
jgi:hypothetical protein